MGKAVILIGNGHYFDFHNPQRSSFNIRDIAHALAHLCRYTGHVKQFYSVAQHSVIVSHQVPATHALAGLLHDAVEAFVGDMSYPLKALLPEYKAIEKRCEAVVLDRFGLAPELPPCVKVADRYVAYWEMRDLLERPLDGVPLVNPDDATPLPSKRLVPCDTDEAFEMFMARFNELTGANW